MSGSGPDVSEASAFFLSFALSAMKLPSRTRLAVRHIIVQAVGARECPGEHARRAAFRLTLLPHVPILPAAALLRHPCFGHTRRGVSFSQASSAERRPPVELYERPLEAELAEIAEGAEPGRTAQLAVRHWGLGRPRRRHARDHRPRVRRHHPRARAPALRAARRHPAPRAGGGAGARTRAGPRRARGARHGARPGPAPRRRAHLVAAVRPGRAAHRRRRPRLRRHLLARLGQRRPRRPARPARPRERHHGRHRRGRRHRPRRRAARGRGPRGRSHGPRGRGPRRLGRRRTGDGHRLRARGLRLARAPHRVVLPARRSPRTPSSRESPRSSASRVRSAWQTCTPASGATSACASS